MANNPFSAIVDFYEVDDRPSIVKLTVKIGFRQNAVSSVLLNQVKLVPVNPNKRNDFGDFVRSFVVDLGSNKELIGKDLTIDTLVQDLNDTDNRTGMDILLEGGVKNRIWKLGPIVVEEGGIIKYTTRISFFKRNFPV